MSVLYGFVSTQLLYLKLGTYIKRMNMGIEESFAGIHVTNFNFLFLLARLRNTHGATSILTRACSKGETQILYISDSGEIL